MYVALMAIGIMVMFFALMSVISKRDLIPLGFLIAMVYAIAFDYRGLVIALAMLYPLYLAVQIIVSRSTGTLGIIYRIRLVCIAIALLLSSIPITMYISMLYHSIEMFANHKWYLGIASITMIYLLLTMLIDPKIDKLSVFGDTLAIDIDKLEHILYIAALVISIPILAYMSILSLAVFLAICIAMLKIFRRLRLTDLNIVMYRIAIATALSIPFILSLLNAYP